MMTNIASFDVFDTVLMRCVGSPDAVFLLLGKQLADRSLINCTPEAFARIRSKVHYRAHKNVQGGHASLYQVYTELAMALRLTATQRNQFMDLECALEAELFRPVPDARARVQAARDRGNRVVFVSDMYLPAEFIQKQLARHGLWAEGDRLYVSNEYRKSKFTGDLFRELIGREGVVPKQVCHCGNDLLGDVESARRVGLQVEPFTAGNLNRYEQILESHAWDTEGLSSAMAGASRLARLTVQASSAREKALRDVTAGVVAPVLVGYVLWVLQRAQQLGLKRLYFVSRDGQIMLEVARMLASKLNISCELRYLYGSRRSWCLL